MSVAVGDPLLAGRDRTAAAGSGLLAGLVNLVVVFALVNLLWYVFLHPNGVLALYTPMYGFSLVAVEVAAIVLIARVGGLYPFHRQTGGAAVRGLLLTLLSLATMLIVVYGVFWGFIGRFGITYFSPYSIIAAGGVGAEMFNARENASTAIVYMATALIWVSLWWSAGFGRWPFAGLSAGALAWSRFASVSLFAILVYVLFFHPHVTHLFYPAQVLAGVDPWWAGFAETSSAYYWLGLLLCGTMWIVISDLLWAGRPWRCLARKPEGSFLAGASLLIGTTILGTATFVVLLRVMEIYWDEPIPGGQYTDAPYFRYLHAGEIAGFVILAAAAVATYFRGLFAGSSLWPRLALRTLLALLGGAMFYGFYYSPASTWLLGKVPGFGQPEDTPLVWTLLFLAVVLIQAELFGGWPLRHSKSRSEPS